MTEDVQRYATLLHQAAALWRVRLDKRLRPWGMTQTTWRTLWILRMDGRSYNQSELAARLGIESPTLVRIIDRMQGMGLLERIADPQDRRQKRIGITPAGLDLVQEIEREVSGLRQELLADAAPQDLQAGIRLLEGIVAKATAERETATPAADGE